MLPKSYIVAKWIVYTLGTLLLLALQHLVLNHISVLGATPFLYPLLPAIASSFEGLRRGSIFSLCLGVVCDLLITGPSDGYYTVMFTIIGIFAALIGENLISTGWLCSLAVSVMALGLNAAARLALMLLAGVPNILLLGHIALIECAVTLPAMLPVLFLYGRIHRRCAVEY